jgi:hypothetical protein
MGMVDRKELETQVLTALRGLAERPHGDGAALEVVHARRRYPVFLGLEKRMENWIRSENPADDIEYEEWVIEARSKQEDYGMHWYVYPQGNPRYEAADPEKRERMGRPMTTLEEAAAKVAQWILDDLIPHMQHHRKYRAAVVWATRCP